MGNFLSPTKKSQTGAEMTISHCLSFSVSQEMSGRKDLAGGLGF